ncbi:MAG: hypothetical protein WKG07_25070 [Hymenobacter sp.]
MQVARASFYPSLGISGGVGVLGALRVSRLLLGFCHAGAAAV